ncbi:MAG: hypothetical protein DRP75_04435, partial [Candidatus Omnitrophota bacterium]
MGKRGVVLITVLLVAVVLFILSGAYMGSSISYARIVERERERLKDFYLAEKGIEYAYIEAQNHGWSWYTHTVDATNTLNIQGNPGVSLAGSIYNSTSGCYEVSTPNGLVEVKTYEDPDHSGEIWVLSRSGDKLVRYKITQRSLYQYFLFWAWDFYLDISYHGKTIDGNPIGRFHTEGNLLLEGGILENFDEISCSGDIRYSDIKYRAPLTWDKYKWSESLKNLVSTTDAPDGLAPIERLRWPDYRFVFIVSPSDYDADLKTYRGQFHDKSIHFYGQDVTDDWSLDLAWNRKPITTSGWAKVKIGDTTTPIPKKLSDAYSPPSWNWTKYDSPKKAGEKGVRFALIYDDKVVADWDSLSKDKQKEMKYEAFKWLVSMEEGEGEYGVSEEEWLSSGIGDDGHWMDKENDKVTLLSIEKEQEDDGAVEWGPGKGVRKSTGAIVSEGDDTGGYDKGLFNLTEYDIYNFVKDYEEDGDKAQLESDIKTKLDSLGEINSDKKAKIIRQWIVGEGGYAGLKDTNGFFDWWRERDYHHKTNLDTDGTVKHFPSDTDTVPAYERIFWE